MELTLADFVLLVLLAAFLLALLLALGSRYAHARTEQRAVARRVICRLCLHAFEDSSQTPIVECPACHTRNEKGCKRNPN